MKQESHIMVTHSQIDIKLGHDEDIESRTGK